MQRQRRRRWSSSSSSSCCRRRAALVVLLAAALAVAAAAQGETGARQTAIGAGAGGNMLPPFDGGGTRDSNLLPPMPTPPPSPPPSPVPPPPPSPARLQLRFQVSLTVAGSCTAKGTAVVARRLDAALKALPVLGGSGKPSGIKVATRCKKRSAAAAAAALKNITLPAGLKKFWKGQVPVYDVVSDVAYVGANDTATLATLLWAKAGPCSGLFPQLCQQFYAADNRTGCVSDARSALASCEALSDACQLAPPPPAPACDSCCPEAPQCDACCEVCQPCNSCCDDSCNPTPPPPPVAGGSDQNIMFNSRLFLFGSAANDNDLLKYWDNSTDMCSGLGGNAWPGLFCWPDDGPRRGRLREINLDVGAMDGRLPPSWGGLQFVESINLNDNFLKGSLPSEWGALQFLKQLRLERNYGPDYSANSGLTGTIPESWSNMTSLVSLGLSNNLLKGAFPYEAWDKGLPALTDFSIASNPELSGFLPPSWPRRPVFRFSWTALDGTAFTGVNFGASGPGYGGLFAGSGPIRKTQLVNWAGLPDNRYGTNNSFVELPCDEDPLSDECVAWEVSSPYSPGYAGGGGGNQTRR